MIIKLNKLLNKTSIFQRRIVLILIDIFIISNILKNQNFITTEAKEDYLILFLITLIFIITYLFTGQYNGITKFQGTTSLYKISIRTFFSLLIYTILCNFYLLNSLSVGNFFYSWASITISTFFYRQIFREIIIKLNKHKNEESINCVIYGAGFSGAQLAKYMELNVNYKVILFIDDNSKLWGRNINDIKISSPKDIKNLSNKVSKLFIASKSITKKRKKEIFNLCNSLSIEVLQVTSVTDITTGGKNSYKLRPFKIEDLLGREVKTIKHYSEQNKIKDSIVCVTGAAGSIGSELCYQLIKFKPKKLILIENSEHKLFEMKSSLNGLRDPECVFILGDVTRKNFVKRVFQQYKINTVFHAAAYKHVPLVELNPIEGIYNNVFSTLAICEAAEVSKVDQILLISTDKAVRPTNIMGASKRLAELVIQAFAANNNSTIFSMVRFGNVLGSSGSVVPIFQNQIDSGGPLTVTHPEVIRYFMTIAEAVYLVIQSIELSKGGDVFLLDMGDPVPIRELASQMIYLNGLRPKNKMHPDGDIEIQYTGLRPGEKLYEELLINAESLPTTHKYIFRANEKNIPIEILLPKLFDLEKYIENNQREEVYDLLSEIIPEWNKRKTKSLK